MITVLSVPTCVCPFFYYLSPHRHGRCFCLLIGGASLLDAQVPRPGIHYGAISRDSSPSLRTSSFRSFSLELPHIEFQKLDETLLIRQSITIQRLEPPVYPLLPFFSLHFYISLFFRAIYDHR